MACFNYGHVSNHCLSKKHDKWRYQEVSHSEVEGTRPNCIYSEGEPNLEPSVFYVRPPNPLFIKKT
jgi:hypothetical protein